MIWLMFGEHAINKCYTFGRATFNNSSVISWMSVFGNFVITLILLVEGTRGPRENHRPAASHWQTVSHNVVHLALIEFELTTSVVIGTDCIGSCKSNYHTITAMMAPRSNCYLYIIFFSIFYRNICLKFLIESKIITEW
jgi:hypothetical protein